MHECTHLHIVCISTHIAKSPSCNMAGKMHLSFSSHTSFFSHNMRRNLCVQRHLPTAARDLALLLPSSTTSSSSGSTYLDEPSSTSTASISAAQPTTEAAAASSSFGSGLASSVFGPGLLSRTSKHSGGGCSVSFFQAQGDATGTSSSSAGSASNDLGVLSRLWSLHFHQRSAAQGNHESFVAVGDAYFYGCGVDGAPASSNPRSSRSSSSSTGSSSSRGSGNGEGTKAIVSTRAAPIAPNYEGALWWYSKAATAKVAKGAYSLGYMYERGLGAPASEARAERHYEKVREILLASPFLLYFFFSINFSFSLLTRKCHIREHCAALNENIFSHSDSFVTFGCCLYQAAELLGQDAEARIARGARGGGEGWWGDWYTSVVLSAATASLRARRSLRAYGLEFLLPPGLF